MTLKRKHEESFYGHGKRWFRGEIIGKEKTGSVYLATPKKPKWRLIANFPTLMAVKSAEISDSGLLQKERMVLESLRGCQYIPRLLGEEVTTGDGGEKVYNLLLEYGSGGTLADLIKNTGGGGGLPESDVRRYARDILLGLKYIQEQGPYGYVYCRLKSQNILLVPDATCNNPKYIAKIGNLGFAKRGKWIKERKCDNWDFGCIVAEMLTGKLSHGFPEIPKWISEEGKDFLKGCLEKEDGPRLTAEMLLKHPFVAEEVDNWDFIPLLEEEELQEEVDDELSSDDDDDDDDELIIPCFSHGWDFIPLH